MIHQVINNRNQTCLTCLEKLQNGKQSGKKWSIRSAIEKISSVQYSQLLLEVSAWKFHTEVNWKIAVSVLLHLLPRDNLLHEDYITAIGVSKSSRIAH